MWPHRQQPTRVLCPWDSPGKSTGVACYFLLQGIFPTQGSNPGLPHCRQTLCHLSHQGSPRRQVRWSGIPSSLRTFHNLLWSTVKGFPIVSETGDVFLEFPCFLHDPINPGNLISSSSAPLKLSLYIWKFSVHILVQLSLKYFEYNLASMWNVCNCAVVWTFFDISLLWGWNESWPFPILLPLLSFLNFLTY